ncbi:putative reverse transcriptase domain-containing protein [Tanacetum coccineum]
MIVTWCLRLLAIGLPFLPSVSDLDHVVTFLPIIGFAYFVGKIFGGDQLLVILCGFGTKSLEFGISFLSITISGVASYAFSDSLLLTPLCCDDIHDFTPRESALRGESKLSDISVVRDFIDVFLEDLSMTTTTTSGVPHRFGLWSDTRVSYDLVIFCKEHQCRLLKRGAWSSFEVSVGITEEGEVHPQADGKSESMVRTLEDIMRECVIDFGGSYHLSIWCAPFEAFYGRKCRSPVIWAEIGGSSLIGPELVQETTDKEVLIKEKLKAARDHQKSYANNRRKPLKFEIAISLRLPEELSGVHDTFHMSNLKKCLADASLHVPLDEIKVDKTLRFVEEPVDNGDREVKRLKCRRMVVVKVHSD